MITGNNLWLALVIGVIPYILRQRFSANGDRLLEAHALFWSIEIHLNSQKHVQWAIGIPLIQRLHNAIWSALMRLREDEPRHK